jgi:glycosyltransferase involved in cell wall biosynthesis
MRDFSLHLPINSVSFGQVSVALLREFHARGLQPCLFPISDQYDLSAQDDLSDDFQKWMTSCLNKRHEQHSRENPTFKLWHLSGSLESFSEKQILFSFHELDEVTSTEKNIAKNNKLIFSSSYSTETFKRSGVDDVSTVPLGFDSHNFKIKDQPYLKDKIVFNLTGKLEKRKNHKQVIQSWVKKYGNSKDYVLQCAISNPFLKQEDFSRLVNEILEGKSYFNVNFLGSMQKNSLYNDYLNSANIILGMSGGEGWGLPEFQSVALGKHAVILNATGYKDWATEKNSILVEPSGKREVYDGIFFNKGQPFNQGGTFVFDDDEFINACEEAIERYKSNPLNEDGVYLQDLFSYKKTADSILKIVEEV